MFVPLYNDMTANIPSLSCSPGADKGHTSIIGHQLYKPTTLAVFTDS